MDSQETEATQVEHMYEPSSEYMHPSYMLSTLTHIYVVIWGER